MTRWCAARKRYGLRPCPKTNSTAFSNGPDPRSIAERSEEHTSELQSRFDLVCRLLLEKKKKTLVDALRTFQERGLVAILTCGATPGFLPLLSVPPAALPAPVEVAAGVSRRFLSRSGLG